MTAQHYITTARLDIYRKHLKVKPAQVMAAYHWNKALAGALLPAMQCLEVTLRNAINTAIQSFPPAGAKGLWDTNTNWVTSLPKYMGDNRVKPSERYKRARNRKDRQDAAGYLLDKWGNRLLARTLIEENLVDQAKSQISKEGKKPTPDRIIAGLTFGFWTTLLTDPYEDPHGDRLLWPTLTSQVFPNAPAGYSRRDICAAFFQIKELRNRLSHHEAVWKFHQKNPATGKTDYSKPVYGTQASCSLLRKHYDDIIEMVGWMSTERKDNFLNHSANLRFYALCSVDGLNSYIAPEKIKEQIEVSNDDNEDINRLINVLGKNEFIRLVKEEQTILTIGTDNSFSLL
ncbi:Abi family protein [Salmonella enterica]|nr:Abi family protein [Salmonella enterica]ELJ4714750.1 Abi family protein [Salmonella enterica]